MKKTLSILLCITMFLCSALPCFAAEVESQSIDFGNGLTATDTLRISTLARGTRIAEKTRTIKSGTAIIAEITIEGVFSYTGTACSVLSKSVTSADTYDGWNYRQNFFIENGGTITLSGNIYKGLTSQDFTLSMTCDVNGNIS